MKEDKEGLLSRFTTSKKCTSRRGRTDFTNKRQRRRKEFILAVEMGRVVIGTPRKSREAESAEGGPPSLRFGSICKLVLELVAKSEEGEGDQTKIGGNVDNSTASTLVFNKDVMSRVSDIISSIWFLMKLLIFCF